VKGWNIGTQVSKLDLFGNFLDPGFQTKPGLDFFFSFKGVKSHNWN
jgi:hypothetical protein